MRIDLHKLQGQREHFDRRFEPAAFEPQEEDYRVAAPVVLSMDVENAGGDVFGVVGHAATRLEVACCRCLEPFEIDVDAQFELRYIPATENTGEGEREIAEDDLTTAFYREGMLDVFEMLREQFQLALPMKPLHDEACRGLCMECGANLNRTDCGHQPVWKDPRLAPLAGLLNRSKEN